MLVILNPWAGRGNAGLHRRDVEDALTQAGLTYKLVETPARGAAITIAQQAVELGCRQIVAVGGDGTINEVVNGIKGAETSCGLRAKLGIIPLGTGSDFVKTIDHAKPNDIAGSVERLVAGHPQAVDLGYVRLDQGQARFFINALGMGLDAQVAAEALKLTRLKGLAVYLTAILRALVNYKAHPMSIEYDDHQIERRLLFASVGNGRCQGGGFWLTPDAMIDDGLLDLCLVDAMRIDEILRHIPKVMKGTHTTLRQVTMGRARHIKLRCAATIPVATDGEVLATNARSVVVELHPQAIDVLT